MRTLKRILTIVLFFVVSNILAQTAKDYLIQGNNKVNNGEYSEALVLFTRAIDLKSDFKQAYTNRGVAYSLINEYDEAISDFTQAIRLSGEDYLLYNYRGMSKFERADGNAEKVRLSLPDLQKAVDLNPEFIEGLLNLSNVYTTLNKHKQAIGYATKAIDQNPDYGKAYYDRGIAYHNTKNLAMACLDWKRAKGRGFAYAGDVLTSFCE